MPMPPPESLPRFDPDSRVNPFVWIVEQTARIRAERAAAQAQRFAAHETSRYERAKAQRGE